MTGVQLLVEIIIADVTTLRNRLFFSYIPATPFIVCTRPARIEYGSNLVIR